MNPTNKFWWFAVFSIAITILFITGLAASTWLQLSPEQKATLLTIGKERAIYLFVISILLAAGLGFGLDAIFHAYILPIARISEEISIISSANPSHRIRMEGGADILHLTRVINEIAERREDLEKNLGEKIRLARKEAEAEKNILATFMSELPEGVLICNSEGKIIMYNNRALSFFGDRAGGEAASQDGGAGKAFIGLGRSIYSVVGEDLIHHALDEMADKLAR
ncbi:MAG: cell wall metabolism sensor histidine kinase WalK, partial [Desulfobacterales bacterium]|nr:cell wall metabolism sensor histidine kinase WalK [Desulfobacterales bacterium]